MDLTKKSMRTRKQVRAKRKRTEAAVIKAVRAACVERDGYCRVWPSRVHSDLATAGESEWAHMPSHRRSKTLGMAPEERHSTAWTLMLCARHHDALDGRTLPKLEIEPLTDRGADGPMRFTYKGKSYSEVA